MVILNSIKLTILFLFVSLSGLQAQDTYFKTIQLFGESFSSGRTIKADGDYFYMQGNTLCTTGQDSFPCMFMSKHNLDGTTVWEDSYSWARPANDLGISIKGDTVICNGHIIPNDPDDTFHLLLLNNVGDSLFRKSWTYTQFDGNGAFTNGHVSVGDEVFMFGQTGRADSIIGLVQKYNLEDGAEATITYNTPIGRTFPGFDMRVDQDSNLVVLNRIDDFPNSFKVIRELLKMDRNGTVIARTYGPDYDFNSNVNNHFLLLNNGNYFFLHSVDHFAGSSAPQIVSMTPEGDVEYTIDFNLPASTDTLGIHTITEISIAQNGDALLCGFRQRSHNVEIDGDDIFIMRVAEDGEVLWKKYYNTPADDVSGDYNFHFCRDIQELQDGSILVVGGAKHHDEIVLLRVDANGCIDGFPCDTEILVGIEDLPPYQAFPDFPHFYPNPTTDLATLDLVDPIEGHIEIYNLKGNQIFTQKLQQTQKLQIELGAYPIGIYFIHIYEDGKLLAIRKVVKASY